MVELAGIRDAGPPLLAIEHGYNQCLMLRFTAQCKFCDCSINHGLLASCTKEAQQRQSIAGSIRYGASVYTVHVLSAALTQFVEMAVIRVLIVQHGFYQCLMLQFASQRTLHTAGGLLLGPCLFNVHQGKKQQQSTEGV